MSTAALETIDGMSAGNGRARSSGDDYVMDVYHYASRCGALTAGSLDLVARHLGLPASEVSAAVEQLLELRLLRPDGAGQERLVPADPASAATLLLAPIEREMYRRREHADRLRERIEAIARPWSGDEPPVGAIDCLEGEMEICGLLKAASDTCRRELVVLRPGHQDEGTLDGLLDICASVLDRGVAVRVICPHSSRASFDSRAKARQLLDDGAQIRTVSYVPYASALFDGSLAVMIGLPAEGRPANARRTSDSGVVRFLLSLVDQLWEGAAPFALEDVGYAAEVTDDLQQRIARLMAEGLTDEVVARRLGMSIRTCRRHIAALLRNLDSVSRFQAGVKAARSLAAEGALSGGVSACPPAPTAG